MINFRIFGHWLKFIFRVEILPSTRHFLKFFKRLVANFDIRWMPLLLVWLEDRVFQWWLCHTRLLSLDDIFFYRTLRLRWLFHVLILITIPKIDRHICNIFLLLIPHFYKRALLLAVFLRTLCPTYITCLFLGHASR